MRDKSEILSKKNADNSTVTSPECLRSEGPQLTIESFRIESGARIIHFFEEPMILQNPQNESSRDGARTSKSGQLRLAKGRGTTGRQESTKKLTHSPHLRDDAVGQRGKVFDMRGMLPPSEARMRMCVMQVGKRGRWTYRDWVRWRFLWKFFPWYAREMRYRGDFCIGATCMHWFWEDAEKKQRGYCSAAVSRTQHMMWQEEWEEGGKPVPRVANPSPRN